MIRLRDGQPVFVALAGGCQMLLKVKSVTASGNGEQTILLDECYDYDGIRFDIITQHGDRFIAEIDGRPINLSVEPATAEPTTTQQEPNPWKFAQ